MNLSGNRNAWKEATMNDLKPCPFCGSEAEIITAWNSVWGKDVYRIACSNKACPIDYIVTKQHATKAEAIAAWNTRATLGRGTCEWVLADKWPNESGDDHVYGYTTECGHRHTWWPESLPNYCPSCGAHVERGDA